MTNGNNEGNGGGGPSGPPPGVVLAEGEQAIKVYIVVPLAVSVTRVSVKMDLEADDDDE